MHLLTPDRLKTTYRFYGARHSSVHVGYKIDFVTLSSLKSSIPQLKEVLHIPYKWNANRERMLIWQHFCSNIFKHLKDVNELDSFYMYLFDWSALRLTKQNPKRVIIEAYLQLLEHEGRLRKSNRCFLCERKIDGKVSLARGFLQAHPECTLSKGFESELLEKLFDEKSTLHVDDESVEKLYRVVEEGI